MNRTGLLLTEATAFLGTIILSLWAATALLVQATPAGITLTISATILFTLWILIRQSRFGRKS
jgi:hypothetical protein